MLTSQGRTAYAALAALALISTCLATNPGFRTAITKKGLDYVRQVGVPLLEEKLSSITIPDISGTSHIKIFGISVGVDYWLTNIHQSGLQIPTASITSGPSGITVTASGISSHITADWKYKQTGWPHTRDSGTCDVSISSVVLSITATVGADSEGHATLSTTGCSFSIGHLKVKFHGGASWLYNLFDDFISGKIKDALQSQVCSAATHYINTAGNAALESLPVVVKLDAVSEINYKLLQAPIFTSTYVETLHKGEFFSVSHPVEASFSPPPLPPLTNTSKMMYVWLTDYIGNTAGLVYQTAGFLKYNITPNMVPPGLPIQLNTSYFQPLIPELYNKYPNMAMMLELLAMKPPVLEIVPKGANFSVYGNVNVYVLDSNQTTHLAFTLGVVLYLDVGVWIHSNGSKEMISANATFLRADIGLVHSNIGKFSVSTLQAAVNILSEKIIVPLLNRYGKVGLPIPTVDGISFINSAVTFGEGYVLVGTDVIYKQSFIEKLRRVT